LLNTAEADTMLAMLTEALEHTRHTHWFDGTLTVINERPILKPGQPRYRPDRLLITPDRRIIVVDYKTGSSEKNSAHHRQVRSYMRLLMESGRYRSAEGWLWYIKENKIEKVEFAK
ncbi:MAG: PD-(D/E)XK nuclease family protein, partial [Muribaculaceae bacterium]|nr:PD-(D/E)XK nuclease family protein [Muribaculaceae bacterium]